MAKALMTQEQKEKFLKDTLPFLLVKYSLSTISREYPITRKMLRAEILKDNNLKNIYIKYHGENGEKKIRTKGKKYKTKPKNYSNNGEKHFTRELRSDGVRNLAIAVIQTAIKENDKYFFTTEWGSLWNFFATGSFDETIEIRKLKEKLHD